MTKKIRIATRKSPLALWQAQFVKDSLIKLNPDLKVVFVGITTEGDREQTKALADIGGKSLFVKELQKALLNDKADLAVHSIKDMSVNDCPGLMLACVCERADPRDAFVSPQYKSLRDLPSGAIVGTSSPRRISIIKSHRPELITKVMRGNVGTRLEKCKTGDYNATILAAAGLKRLGLEKHISEYLDPKQFIPAIGQGAIGIECREEDVNIIHLLNELNHTETEKCIIAERAVNKVLGGDCHTPIAAYATIKENMLSLDSMVGNLDGKNIVHYKLSGHKDDAALIGEEVGHELIKRGANV